VGDKNSKEIVGSAMWNLRASQPNKATPVKVDFVQFVGQLETFCPHPPSFFFLLSASNTGLLFSSCFTREVLQGSDGARQYARPSTLITSARGTGASFASTEWTLLLETTCRLALLQGEAKADFWVQKLSE